MADRESQESCGKGDNIPGEGKEVALKGKVIFSVENEVSISLFVHFFILSFLLSLLCLSSFLTPSFSFPLPLSFAS